METFLYVKIGHIRPKMRSMFPVGLGPKIKDLYIAFFCTKYFSVSLFTCHVHIFATSWKIFFLLFGFSYFSLINSTRSSFVYSTWSDKKLHFTYSASMQFKKYKYVLRPHTLMRNEKKLQKFEYSMSLIIHGNFTIF